MSVWVILCNMREPDELRERIFFEGELDAIMYLDHIKMNLQDVGVQVPIGAYSIVKLEQWKEED